MTGPEIIDKPWFSNLTPEEYYKLLESEEKQFDENHGGIVRKVSDFFSGIGNHRDAFHQQMNRAKEALNRFDSAHAIGALESARRTWNRYVVKTRVRDERNTKGALTTGLLTVEIGTSFYPYLWLALNLHVLGGWVLLSNSNQSDSEKMVFPPEQSALSNPSTFTSTKKESPFILFKQRLNDGAEEHLSNPNLPFDPAFFFIKDGLYDKLSSRVHTSQSFQLMLELIPRYEKDWQNKTDLYFEPMREQNDFDHRLQTFSDLMESDLFNYAAGQYSFVLAQEGDRKNCISRTIWALSSAKRVFPLEKGMRFGIQLSPGHIEPVILSEQQGVKKVFSLLTGELIDESDSNGFLNFQIYEDKLLLFSDLKGQGITPKVPLDSLRMADVSPSRKEALEKEFQKAGQKTSLKFPILYGSDKDVPDRTYDLKRKNGKPINLNDPHLAFVLKDIKDAELKKFGERRANSGGKNQFFFISYKGTQYPIFTNPVDADEYNSFSSIEDEEEKNTAQENFLYILSEEFLAKQLNSEGGQLAFSLYSSENYELFRQIQKEDYGKINSSLINVYFIPHHLSSFLGIRANPLYYQNTSSSVINNFIKEIEDHFKKMNPSYALFFERKANFRQKAIENPKKTLLLLDQLNSGARFVFLRMLGLPIPSELFHLMIDRKKVMIGDKPKNFVAYTPVTIAKDNEPSQLQFQSKINHKKEEATLKDNSPHKKSMEGEKGNEEMIRISFECFFDITLFNTGQIELYQRWDSEMSKKFSEINQHGHYDLGFLYQHARLASAKSSQFPRTPLVPNPITEKMLKEMIEKNHWNYEIQHIEFVPQDMANVLLDIKRRRLPSVKLN